MTYLNSIISSTDPNSATADPFGRDRVSVHGDRIDIQFNYDLRPLLFDQIVSGTGASITHDANMRAAKLTVGTASGESAMLRQHYWNPCTAGSGQSIIMTGILVKKTNVISRMGYYDDNNGVYWEVNQSGHSIVLRSKVSGSVVETTKTQSAWNLDTLDGSGNEYNPSGKDLDESYAQILEMDAQALKVGRVRVGFNMDGVFTPVHEFLNDNRYAYPYTQYFDLPLTWEIKTFDTAADASDLYAICGTVFSEGGNNLLDIPGLPFTTNNGITAISVTTRRPILSIRPAATFNSITNRSLIIPKSIDVLVGSNNALIEIVRNGTLTGASFSAVNASSATEKDTSASAIANGIVVDSFHAVSGSGSSRLQTIRGLGKVLLSLDAAGSTADILSIVATSFTSTATVASAIDWKEIR